MSQPANSELFEKIVQGLVRIKARQLIGCGAFRRQDRNDLKQTLIIRLLQSLRTYQPQRGALKPFLKVVVDRFAKNLLRQRYAQKRNPHRLTTWDDRLRCAALGGKWDPRIGHCCVPARLGQTQRSDQEVCDLEMDVGTVIGQLHPQLQQLAKQLKHNTISEVARDLGLPRGTIYEAVGIIRRRFERAGLKKYLEHFRHPVDQPVN